MGKPHKLANARIEIDTALPPVRVADVARQVVGTQRALKVTGEGEGALRVQVLQGLISAPVMTFVVSAEPNGGRTSVVSAIDEYRTSQTTVYFVPVTSKSMEGMGVYRRFMVSFGQAMQAADPSAHVQMIERDQPGGSVPPSGSVLPAVPLPGTSTDAGASVAPIPAVPLPSVPQPVAPSPEASQTVADPVPAPSAGSAPAAPAAAPAVPATAAPAPAAPLLSESNARIVQIVGGVIVVAGMIFWYATPSNVTVGPLLVILLGAVVAGAGFIIGRNAGRAAADELASRLRHERTLAGVPPTTPAVPLPPSTPAVPMPPVTPVPADEAAPPVPPVPPVPLPRGAPVAPSALDVAMARADLLQPSTPQVPDPAPVGPISSIPGMGAPSAAPRSTSVAPQPISIPAPAPGSAAEAVVDAPPVDDLDATRISPAQSAAEWQLVLADGRRLTVASALRIGRDPIADPAAPGTVLVPIDDPAKSLSKTHAQLEAGDADIVITDLHSTNGTKVRTSDGIEVVLSAEIGHRLTGDAELSFGDYVVRLQRGGAL